MRGVSLLGSAILLVAGVASAQSTPSQDQSSTATGYSSSQAGLQEFAELALPSAPAPGASALGSGGSAAGQYGNGGGSGGGNHGFLHNRSWTFEAGAGFNGPIGNDTGNGAGTSAPVISWGGNFTGGGGLRFYKRLSVLAEYQFMDNKLPAALLAEFPAEDQITAGNTHINSITGSPVIHLFPKRTNGVYLVGGFGWYHKSTNFQTPERILLLRRRMSPSLLSPRISGAATPASAFTIALAAACMATTAAIPSFSPRRATRLFTRPPSLKATA